MKLTINDLRLFGDFLDRKGSKFVNFRANLVEFLVQKVHLLVGTQ